MPPQGHQTSSPAKPAREIRATAPRAEPEALRRDYLDLLKLSLCDLVGVGTQMVFWTDDRRAFSRLLSDETQLRWRVDGSDWPLNALTMVGLNRLDDLQTCVETIVADAVAGDLIEAGTWRGGASMLMRATLDTLGAHDRRVWLADSFQGFPLPDSGEPDYELESHMSPADHLAPRLEDVQGYFARFGLQDRVEFVPGFFEETMHQLAGRRWSLVRLDADSYRATRLALETLYPGLAVGGHVVVDDFFLPPCREAVEDFRREHEITEPLQRIDWTAVRWRRETETFSDAPAATADRSVGLEQPAPRAAAQRARARIPTDRELELEDQLTALRARVSELEQQLAAKRSRLRAPRWIERRR